MVGDGVFVVGGGNFGSGVRVRFFGVVWVIY